MNRFELEEGPLKRYYRNARPFPHFVSDSIFNLRDVRALAASVPPLDDSWYRYNNCFEVKRAMDRIHGLSPTIDRWIEFFASRYFLNFAEKITGIDGLLPDPDLRGGGFHLIERGGKLDIHADYNIHPKLGLERRLNGILFLNEDWEEKWGGELELWDQEMRECQARIKPSLGTFVLFNVDDQSFHGHPDPLSCPAGISRKSFAVYYYTKPRSQDMRPHSTLYQKRPNEPLDLQKEELRRLRAKGRLPDGATSPNPRPA